jgi:hypothetical protein
MRRFASCPKLHDFIVIWRILQQGQIRAHGEEQLKISKRCESGKSPRADENADTPLWLWLLK